MRIHPRYGHSMPRQRRTSATPLAVLGGGALFLAAGIGANLELAALSIAVLIAGVMMLWRQGEPPLLLIVFGYPWVQASVPTFSANLRGVDINASSFVGAEMVWATILSLLAVLALAIGARAAIGSGAPNISAAARQTALSRSMSAWGVLYVAGVILSFVATGSAWVVPGLTQVLLAVAGTKWIFFFLLAFAAFAQRRPAHPIFLAAFAFELALGIGGFFSDFKTVFIFVALAAFAANVRVSTGGWIGGAMLAVVVVLLGITWTAVKPEYRTFVSSGTGSQLVTIDYSTRMTKLLDLVQALGPKEFGEGFENFLDRLGYVGFFGLTLTTVPHIIPHEGGALLWDSVSRPFMPRLFFPNKPVVDDTVRTNVYTAGAAGNSEATSISLGWAAEMYIDFGALGMLAASLLIGVLYGRIYRVLLFSRLTGPLFGMAAACSVLALVGQLESSFTKIFGGIVVQLLVIWVFAKFVLPRFFPWVVR